MECSGDNLLLFLYSVVTTLYLILNSFSTYPMKNFHLPWQFQFSLRTILRLWPWPSDNYTMFLNSDAFNLLTGCIITHAVWNYMKLREFDTPHSFLLGWEATFVKSRPQGYKTFFMLNSAEHEIFSANKYENANNSWHFHIY